MPEPDRKHPILLVLAAEGVLPVLAGCAGVAAAGPVGGMVGVAVGQVVERAINLFGRGIVARWQAWFAAHPDEAKAAVAELAAAPPAEARAAARSIFLDLAPDAAPEDVDRAVEFLTAIPPAVDRALVPDAAGTRSVPPTVLWDDPRSLLQLLPEDVPPYPAGSPLTGTPYRLRELLGAGGFGAVYRAESPSLQHLPLAIKFCLDPSLLPALHRERSNLERLMRAAGRGSAHVVRLYGYDLDHATPYLVYEFVDGGDLTRLLAARVAALGRAPAAAEVFGWVTQITEGLAFAHAAGLVHRDLKPANVLVSRGVEESRSGGVQPPDSSTPPPLDSSTPRLLKLGDFGIGGVAAAAAAGRSRIGASTIDFLSLADQASLFRGAGTPLYMSPEQRRGAAPDARHDLYALGVMWFQLLVGDVSRELPHGWAKELTVRYGVPAAHVALIERCVGWMDERPKDAGELLALLKASDAGASPGREPGDSPTPPDAPGIPGLTPGARPDAPTVSNAAQVTPSPLADGRRRGLVAALARLGTAYDDLNDMAKWTFGATARWGLLFGGLAGAIPLAVSGPRYSGESIVVAVCIAPLVWGLYVGVMRAGVNAVAADLRKKADKLAEEVAADFPVEVAGLGGLAALRHPSTVRRIRAELDPPPPVAVPATASLTADEIPGNPTRKALLVGRLSELRAVRKSTKDAKDGSWVAVAFFWLFGVPVVTLSVFALFSEALGWPKVVSVMPTASAAVGTFILGWWGAAKIRGNQDRKWAGVCDRFAADYPRLVETWGGRHVLESAEAMDAVTKLIDPTAGSGSGGLFRRLFGG